MKSLLLPMRGIKGGFFILLFSLFTLFPAFAQQTQIKRIEITRYNRLIFNSPISPGAERVLGDVEFQHEGMTMTCDSAYLYGQSNMLDAFGNVHITNAKRTMTIDGEFARYQGNNKNAEIWRNVVLVDSNAVLKTQHLYYDLNTEIAYYLNGAEIFNKGNDMVSKRGHYHRNIDMFYFKNDVVLNTPDYIIKTDTLNYNVETKVADFVGPTYIENEKKDTIYCELGWYNTNDTVALFRRNAWIKSGSTTVNADTLYYESQTGNGRAFSNIVVEDTTNNVILKGHKGSFNNVTEEAWLTNRALLIMAGEKDSLFLHADTLRSDVDTAGFKIIRAYNRVRFFSVDMQGKCDSLGVWLKDTIIHMFRNPILWAQDNQMTADKIEIETENQKPRRLNLNNKGFIVQEDPKGFNQIKGRKIVGLFRDGELYRVNGFNDSETVYFIYDADDVTGVNKVKSPDVEIIIEERKAQEVTHRGESEGETIPPNEFDPAELTLSGFKWLIELKPVDKDDIYEWREETAQSKTAPSTITNTNDKPAETTRPAPAGRNGTRMPTRR